MKTTTIKKKYTQPTLLFYLFYNNHSISHDEACQNSVRTSTEFSNFTAHYTQVNAKTQDTCVLSISVSLLSRCRFHSHNFLSFDPLHF